MAKLFPPLIEGTIPAFYSDNGTVLLTVPFSMNRAVSRNQVGGLVLKVKTAQSSTYLFTKTVTDTNDFELEDSCYADFYLNKEDIAKLKEGQLYKCQLAYLDNGSPKQEIGHYSTVGLVKYTTKPEVNIVGLNPYEINTHTFEYMGYYSQKDGDITERVYSYCFDVYDSYNQLFSSSGWQLHNCDNDDTISESYDSFILQQDLQIDASFYIVYRVKTTNNLNISTDKYRIMQKLSVEPEIKATIAAELNYNNGYVKIKLIGTTDEYGLETPCTGAFLLTRSSEDTGYSVWEEISRFKLASQKPSRDLWNDYTVQQGKNYRYALQQYSDTGLYSNKILSNKLYVDFEDAFLFDGERQLKIKYNPKITSFKPDVLETKVDTIGGKHPFIFRNGRVYYREFPISGLISYQMDEEKLFLPKEEFNPLNKTTQLTGENIAAEREFKLKVLEWLTNGEPKIFRSPTEGNYIVRLMNTSMTPTDQVGRMLHTFQSTAYEIADFTYENLQKYDFIHLTDPEVAAMRWETVNFYETDQKGHVTYKTGQMNNHKAYTVRISDLMPGDYIYLITNPRFDFNTATEAQRNEYKIMIGFTGSYYIDSKIPIEQIIVPSGARYNGSMTYSYYSVLPNRFNKISGVKVSEIPAQQFIGEHNIIQEIECVLYNGKWVKNPKVDIVEFYDIHATKRTVEKCLYDDYSGTYRKHDGVAFTPDIFDLYAIGTWKTEGPGYRPGYPEKKYQISHYRDPANKNMKIVSDAYSPTIAVNGNEISVYETETYHLYKPGKIDSLICGNGTTVEVAYQMRTIDYFIEDDPNWGVKPFKEEYLKAVEELKDYLSKVDDSTLDIEASKRQKVVDTYKNFIKVLIAKQEEERVADGLL